MHPFSILTFTLTTRDLPVTPVKFVLSLLFLLPWLHVFLRLLNLVWLSLLAILIACVDKIPKLQLLLHRAHLVLFLILKLLVIRHLHFLTLSRPSVWRHSLLLCHQFLFCFSSFICLFVFFRSFIDLAALSLFLTSPPSSFILFTFPSNRLANLRV